MRRRPPPPLREGAGGGWREEEGAEGRALPPWEGCGRTPGGGGKNTGEREGEGRTKKIGGQHITVGSYYNPAVMLTYHRRFVIRPGGDAQSYYEPAVICKHHRRVHLEPEVIDYHRRFETNRR